MEQLKTSLKLKEKVMALSAITMFGVAMSIFIGKHLASQSILTIFILYMLTGNRPTYAFAQCKTIKRDLL
jgi:hypothetical protein